MRHVRRPLVHELVFGAFVAATTARLGFATGWTSALTLVWAGVLLANVAVVAWTDRHPSVARWRVRLLYHVIAMNLLFQHMRHAIPAINPWDADPALLAIDTAVLGGTPALLLESWTRPWLTDVMAFCYFVFLPYLFLSLAWYFFRPIALAQRFWAGLFTLYGIGFLGYSLVPAGGPWLALADRFTIPLEGSAPTATLLGIIAAGTNGVDVFPSLHCAVSAYCLFFDRRHARWRYYAYLGPCIVLWASTLYLRYHYLVDLAAGFALAAFATWVAKRFEPCPVPETAA